MVGVAAPPGVIGEFVANEENATHHEQQAPLVKDDGGHNKWQGDVNFDEEQEYMKKRQMMMIRQQQQQDSRGMKQPYERRQNKLPPRLAKQREQNRLAQKTRDGWPANSGGPGAIGSETSGHGWRAPNDMPGGHQQQDQMDHLSEMLGKMDKDLQQANAGGRQTGGGGESQDQDLPLHTIIFENTNFKGGAGAAAGAGSGNRAAMPGLANPNGGAVSDKLFKSDFKMEGGGPGAAGMPMNIVGFSKPEDSADLKLDFNFGESDIGVPPVAVVGAEDKMDGGVAIKSLSGHPSTEDLNLKIASVKKVWETRPTGGAACGGMPSISEGPAVSNAQVSVANRNSGSFVQRYGGDDDGNSGSREHMYDKHDGSNVAKVRPQQQQQQQQHMGSRAQQQQQQQQQSLGSHMDQRGMAAVAMQAAAANANYSHRAHGGVSTTNVGLSALPSPPSMLANQPPSLYQAFQIDQRNVTNPLYPAYAAAGLGGQSMLLQSAAASAAAGAAHHDIFGQSAAASNQFRLQQAAAAAAQFAAAANQPPPAISQHSSVLMSQPGAPAGNLMNSSMKQSPQIGPIGTKGGAGPTSGLGTLPTGPPPGSVAGSSQQLLIPYDTNPMSMNYMQGLQGRGGPVGAQSGQTAFYHTLAAAAAAASSQQASNGTQQGQGGGRHFGMHGGGFSSGWC